MVAADVAGVDDVVDVREDVGDARVEEAVRVGDDSYAHTLWSAAAMPPLSERRHGRRTPHHAAQTLAFFAHVESW